MLRTPGAVSLFEIPGLCKSGAETCSTADVGLELDGEAVVIRVRDNGIGFDMI